MKKPRRKFDYYPTPDSALRPYLGWTFPLFMTHGPIILDCCAGTGNIGKALATRYPDAEIAAIELQEKFLPALRDCGAYSFITIGNVFTLPQETFHGYDVIISNPPFDVAVEMIEVMLHHAPRVIVLLRSAFTASQDRWPFWNNAPQCHISFLSNRPGFTEDGETGQYDYAWFDFSHRRGGPNTWEVLPPYDKAAANGQQRLGAF